MPGSPSHLFAACLFASFARPSPSPRAWSVTMSPAVVHWRFTPAHPAHTTRTLVRDPPSVQIMCGTRLLLFLRPHTQQQHTPKIKTKNQVRIFEQPRPQKVHESVVPKKDISLDSFDKIGPGAAQRPGRGQRGLLRRKGRAPCPDDCRGLRREAQPMRETSVDFFLGVPPE